MENESSALNRCCEGHEPLFHSMLQECENTDPPAERLTTDTSAERSRDL